MLIKIRNDEYINSEKIESLVIVCAVNHYDVYAHMSTSDTVSYAVSTGHKTFKEAEQAMDELAVTINNAGRTGRKIADSKEAKND